MKREMKTSADEKDIICNFCEQLPVGQAHDQTLRSENKVGRKD